MTPETVIARKKELKALTSALNSPESEFIALYGRRRVGKTFLIRSVFSKEQNYLEVIGKKGAPLSEQLKIFAEAFSERYLSGAAVRVESWKAAFDLVYKQAQKTSDTFVLFLDELPWLATPRSRLLEELEHFWNSKFVRLNNFKLIVCGSAAAWIHKNIIHSKSGLHNRLTRMILLETFTLKESEEYLRSKRSYDLGFEHLLDIYMCMGGIPYYLNGVESGKSSTQVIHDLCFTKSGLLHKEFESLFASLFGTNPEYENIVRLLAGKHYGISRSEIVAGIGASNGGAISDILFNLEASGFINKYVPFGGKQKDSYYLLVDPYTLFYLNWIARSKLSGLKLSSDYWMKQSNTQAFKIWAGYSFEIVCLNHVEQINRALGISGIAVLPSTWQGESATERAQVNLVLDRADRIVNLCEIKYRRGGMKIDNQVRKELLRKQAVFREATKTKKVVTSVVISAHGFLDEFAADSALTGAVSGEDLMGGM